MEQKVTKDKIEVKINFGKEISLKNLLEPTSVQLEGFFKIILRTLENYYTLS